MTSSPSARLDRLATASIGRLLWQYSIPAIVGIVVMQLYNIVDRIFIGQVVGANAIAGLAITFPVTNIATAMGVLFGAGASARISIALGASDPAKARQIAGNTLVMLLIVGISYISLFAVFIDPLLHAFGATADTIPYARDMMLWVLPGLLLTNLTFSFNSVMRASGFPVKAMVTMFIGAGVNIILDPVFIYWLGWGIKGAALATDIAMAVSCAFVMWHFIRPNGGEVYFTRGIYRLRRHIVGAIVSIGAAPSLVNLAGCLIGVLINRSLLTYGNGDPGAIASAGVFVTVTSFVCCIILGLCQGMQPIAGYNYGNGRHDRLRRVYWLSVAWATGISTLGCLAGELWPQTLSAAFVNEPALIASTARFMQMAMAVFWMVGFQIVTTTFFQAIGSASVSIFLSLIRQVLFLIPLLLLLPRAIGIDGVWYSFPASDLLATAVTAACIIRFFKAK